MSACEESLTKNGETTSLTSGKQHETRIACLSTSSLILLNMVCRKIVIYANAYAREKNDKDKLNQSLNEKQCIITNVYIPRRINMTNW